MGTATHVCVALHAGSVALRRCPSTRALSPSLARCCTSSCALCRLEVPAVAAGQVVLVDGNQMFNRPGPRLVDALEFLAGLLHGKPELIPADFPWTRWQPQQAQQA